VYDHTDALLPKVAASKSHLKDHALIVGNDGIGLQKTADVRQTTKGKSRFEMTQSHERTKKRNGKRQRPSAVAGVPVVQEGRPTCTPRLHTRVPFVLCVHHVRMDASMAATLANLTHCNGHYCGVVTQDASRQGVCTRLQDLGGDPLYRAGVRAVLHSARARCTSTSLPYAQLTLARDWVRIVWGETLAGVVYHLLHAPVDPDSGEAQSFL
jgi:hypothetical protein